MNRYKVTFNGILQSQCTVYLLAEDQIDAYYQAWYRYCQDNSQIISVIRL